MWLRLLVARNNWSFWELWCYVSLTKSAFSLLTQTLIVSLSILYSFCGGSWIWFLVFGFCDWVFERFGSSRRCRKLCLLRRVSGELPDSVSRSSRIESSESAMDVSEGMLSFSFGIGLVLYSPFGCWWENSTILSKLTNELVKDELLSFVFDWETDSEVHLSWGIGE